MESRQMIIQSVMQVLKSKVDQETLDIVQDALTIELNRYEVQERTTELSVVDNSAVGMLRRYIATKRIEGKAESTLKRYWEQNLQLIQFLGKDLNKITTDDLRLFMACRRQQNKVSNRTLDGMRNKKAQIEQIVNQISERANLVRQLYPHLIRHTTATMSLERGMDVTELQKMLGHEKLDTTMIYAKVSQESLKYSHHRYVV